MKKILSIESAAQLSKKFRAEGKRIVLAGGCFDILHRGHIRFLEKAKAKGDILIVILESDQKIQELKGKNRPVNIQKNRALALSALEYVDIVIPLPYLKADSEYDDMISLLKPAIIATTNGDPYRSHKERQAKKIGSEVIDVIERIENQSTTKLASLYIK